jgi:hypothetical protein
MLAVLVLAAHAAVPYACPTIDDTVAVYCEAMRELLSRYHAPVTRIVLVDRTKLGVIGELDEEYAAKMLQTTPDAVRDLKAVNLKPAAFPPNLEFEVPHVVLPEAAAVRAYQPVRTDLPLAGNILVRLSAISFSGDRREALVYAGYTCGGLCGEGVIIRVVRVADGWRVARSMMVWVS